MSPAGDLAWPEPRSHEHRPQISRVVVALVIVHLQRGTKTETKRRELEPALATPRGNVYESKTARRQYATEAIERGLRLVEMLKYRETQNDIERSVRDHGQDAPDLIFGRLHLGMAPKVFGELNIDKQHVLDPGKNLPRKTGVVAAAEVGNALAGKRGVAPNCHRAKPDAKTIDERRGIFLTVCLVTHLLAHVEPIVA